MEEGRPKVFLLSRCERIGWLVGRSGVLGLPIFCPFFSAEKKSEEGGGERKVLKAAGAFMSLPGGR